MDNEFKVGLRDGIPIALGYLAVSFGVGIMVVASGLTAFEGGVISLSNVTSAGEFAGLKIIAASGTILELILTQVIINLRYALMSLSLSQKLSKEVTLWQRFIIAFANTDEIFAVAIAHNKSLTFRYMIGLQLLPIIGWTSGTVLGAICGNIMPLSLRVATGVALYAMFIAIVIPVARKMKSVCIVASIAILLSCIMYYIPIFSCISEGVQIIICTVVSAGIGAILFPIEQSEEEAE